MHNSLTLHIAPSDGREWTVGLIAEERGLEWTSAEPLASWVTPHRRRHEAAIREWVAAQSLAHSARIELTSPLPTLAFRGESDGEVRNLMRQSSFPVGSAVASIRLDIQLSGWSSEASLGLADRSEGATRLAAVPRQDLLSGFRSLVLFFEEALGNDFTRSQAVVHQLLLQLPDLGYTKAEVDHWASLRNGAMHADERISRRVHEEDVRLLVPRFQQAALVALVNKATWGDLDATLRDTWQPSPAYGDPDMRIVVVEEGGDLTLNARFLDHFGVWPLENSNLSLAASDADQWYTPLELQRLVSDAIKLRVV